MSKSSTRAISSPPGAMTSAPCEFRNKCSLYVYKALYIPLQDPPPPPQVSSHYSYSSPPPPITSVLSLQEPPTPITSVLSLREPPPPPPHHKCPLITGVPPPSQVSSHYRCPPSHVSSHYRSPPPSQVSSHYRCPPPPPITSVLSLQVPPSPVSSSLQNPPPPPHKYPLITGAPITTVSSLFTGVISSQGVQWHAQLLLYMLDVISSQAALIHHRCPLITGALLITDALSSQVPSHHRFLFSQFVLSSKGVQWACTVAS